MTNSNNPNNRNNPKTGNTLAPNLDLASTFGAETKKDDQENYRELNHDLRKELGIEIDNLPNRLTVFRILLIPIIIGCLLLRLLDLPSLSAYYSTFEWVAAWTFAIAAITDGVDGYIARKRNIVTVFGSFLDPIADKFLTISSLITLQALGRVPVLIVIILVLRELYMTSLRLLATHEGLSVPVNFLGKWKTIMQMVGIPLAMISTAPFGIKLLTLGQICIYIASFLSLYSSIVYSMGLVKKIKQSRLERRARKLAAMAEASNENSKSTNNEVGVNTATTTAAN